MFFFLEGKNEVLGDRKLSIGQSKNEVYGSRTCALLINQVILAGGLVGPNEQLALILSPTSYLCFAGSINGTLSVNSK